MKPDRVCRYESFRQNDEPGTICPSLTNKITRLLSRSITVEKHRCRLYSRAFYRWKCITHISDYSVNKGARRIRVLQPKVHDYGTSIGFTRTHEYGECVDKHEQSSEWRTLVASGTVKETLDYQIL